MSKKKTSKAASGAKPSKKSNLPLICTAAAVVIVAVIAVIVGNSSGKAPKNTKNAQVISAGEYLTIPVSEITATASFYPIVVDGTEMEVFAIKAPDGTIRTAFNTCQSCYTSGRGYYVQQGRDLVCQNCGYHFSPEQVEIRSGGCNPWPIFPEDKTVTADSIQISYDFLKKSSSIFTNWKR